MNSTPKQGAVFYCYLLISLNTKDNIIPNHCNNTFHFEGSPQDIAELKRRLIVFRQPEDEEYNGKSYNTDFGFNWLLYRDAHRKTYLGTKLWTRETQSYIDDAEITVQRCKTAGWLAELSHKEYIGNSTANFKIAYKRGTGMNDALHTPEEAFMRFQVVKINEMFDLEV